MGKWRNNPLKKEKGQISRKRLNEIEANDLSDIEFKVVIIRMLKELSENYKELSGNNINMKNDIETMT